MAIQVYGFRNIHGGIVPERNVKANAAITTGYGTPMYDLGTGYWGACADAATLVQGWLVGGQGHATSFYTPGADAQGDDITIVAAYPGIQALMRSKGTAAITLLDALIDLDFLDAANYYAEVDVESGGDGLILREYFTNVSGTVMAWVEANYAKGYLIGV